jgi:hypothetical protein
MNKTINFNTKCEGNNLKHTALLKMPTARSFEPIPLLLVFRTLLLEFKAQSLPFSIWYQILLLCLIGMLHPLAHVQNGVRKGWLRCGAN